MCTAKEGIKRIISSFVQGILSSCLTLQCALWDFRWARSLSEGSLTPQDSCRETRLCTLSHLWSACNLFLSISLSVLSHWVMSNSLQPHGLWTTRLLCPWDFPGENIRAGCHFLLLGIFWTQGWNLCLLYLLCLLHCQVDSVPLCHLGSPLSPCYCYCCC